MASVAVSLVALLFGSAFLWLLIPKMPMLKTGYAYSSPQGETMERFLISVFGGLVFACVVMIVIVIFDVLK